MAEVFRPVNRFIQKQVGFALGYLIFPRTAFINPILYIFNLYISSRPSHSQKREQLGFVEFQEKEGIHSWT